MLEVMSILIINEFVSPLLTSFLTYPYSYFSLDLKQNYNHRLSQKNHVIPNLAKQPLVCYTDGSFSFP